MLCKFRILKKYIIERCCILDRANARDGDNVIPYLVFFTLSILVCAAGELALRKSRAAGVILFTLSTAFPVVLAGAREFTVGTDIATYGNYVFQAACRARRLRYYLRSQREIEPLYKALAFAVSRFTNNPHWFYFMTALIICLFTMAGLWYYRRWSSITLGWACFLFLFYGDTLNTMRQCLALAIVFSAFPLFLEKKYIWFGLFSVIAVMFHVTGIIALALPVIYLFMKKIPPRWLQFFLIIACMGVIMFYSPLLQIAIERKLLPVKFTRYMADGVAFALNPTLLRLPFLIPVIMYYDRFCGFGTGTGAFSGGAVSAGGTDSTDSTDYIKDADLSYRGFRSDIFGMFALVMLLLEICTIQLRSVHPALYRVSYYFGYYRFIAYPRLVRILRRDNRYIVGAVLILYLVVIWYYQNVMQGNNQIYPYVYSPGWYEKIIYVMPAE